MTQTLDVAKSKQWVSPSPRVRRWAARLALLVACVGSVATSSSNSASAEYEGPLLRLTPEQPKLTRTLVTTLSGKESSPISADISLTAQLTVTWKPTDPTHQTQPKVEVTLRPQDDSGSPPGAGSTVKLLSAGQEANLYATEAGCSLTSTCERLTLLTLELQPGAPPGTLEVAWKVKAESYTMDSLKNPDAFTLRLTEP